jgi:hypothetical protein
MRIGDPAVAVVRPAELSVLSVVPAPDVEGSEQTVEAPLLNVGLGAPYARVPSERTRWLTLVVDVETEASGDAPEDAGTADPAAEQAPLAPLAAGLETVAAGLFESPTSLVALLQAANEHRRIVDLLWAAHEIGAVRLPAALAERIERARQSWPSVLPGSVALAPA